MAIQPAQPQSIGGVLDTTFQLYKASIGKVWPLCLLAAIGGSLPTIYMVTKGLGNPNDPVTGSRTQSQLQYRCGPWARCTSRVIPSA